MAIRRIRPGRRARRVRIVLATVIFPAAPDRSLLLQKATATLPHGGGKRLEIDSDDYKLLVRWITQGMPYGKPTDPTVAKNLEHLIAAVRQFIRQAPRG